MEMSECKLSRLRMPLGILPVVIRLSIPELTTDL